MPCYDGRCSEKERIVYRDNPALKVLVERNDILTRMLCNAIETLQKSYDTDIDNCSLETQVWWEEHQIFDKERKAEEERIAKSIKELEEGQ